MFVRLPRLNNFAEFLLNGCSFGMRGWLWISFLVLVLFVSPPAAGAYEQAPLKYFIRSWKTENGLPDNTVTAVVQTQDGYLWAGTYGGLVRFDGIHFKVFNSASTPGLQSDRVTSLFEDASGTLWIGHEPGDLTRYAGGKFEPLAVHETGVRRKITAIETDQDGDIWMLNEEGTLVRERDGVSCSLPNTDGLAEMAQDGRGKLWVTSGGQIAALERGKLHLLSNTNNSSGVGNFVPGICASHDGGLWIVRDLQVGKWSGSTMTEDRGTNPCNATIVTMLETRSGVLAMGTSSDGLYLLFPNRTVVHFNHATGFPSDWIRCLHEDREGTLWVGAGSVGLIALRPGNIESLNSPENWQGRVALSATSARNGAIWVGSEGAGLYRFQNGVWKNYSESAGISNSYVWCASEDAQGRIWAGTWGGGMFVQSGDRFVAPRGLEKIKVPMPAILHAPDGVTWIGTASGLLRYDRGAVKWYGERDGLKIPDVRTILRDRDGTIWFGMMGGGLARLQNEKLEQFLKRDGLASDYVQCLHQGEDGALWIGTFGSGLNRYQNGRFAKVAETEGLPNNFICAMEEDSHGSFWISSHGGIFRVSKRALKECADGKISTVSCLTYGAGDGLPSLQCSGGLQPAACALADGRICFPTSMGLVLVNPDSAKVNNLPPPVIIEDVVANGRRLAQNPDEKTPLKIPPGVQRYEFHYTGLSFISQERMRFQYRLEGWEKDWVDAANNKRVAEYSYIPPGRYTFHVRACNSDGVWNEAGAAFALTVLPHFWQTFWFHLFTVLAAVACVVGIVLLITRRRMWLKLERIERQQALERERTRIAKDIHDHLGANLTRISLLSQSVQGDLQNHAQAAEQLDRIYETTRELTRSMDEIVWALNPLHDTLDSLASYLGNFAQDYLVSLSFRCRLDMPLHLPNWPITAEMRHNIFLAFKEALHNVVKHSAAREVSVSLATDNYGFQLAVRDNGVGFDPAAVAPRPGHGNGLKNMKQRLEKIGGRCEIQSSLGHGADIHFFISAPSAHAMALERKSCHQ